MLCEGVIRLFDKGALRVKVFYSRAGSARSTGASASSRRQQQPGFVDRIMQKACIHRIPLESPNILGAVLRSTPVLLVVSG